MIEDGILKLVPPNQELVSEFQTCLIESYEDHKKFLHWVEPNPKLEKISKNMKNAQDNFSNKEKELRFIVLRKDDNRMVGCVGLIIRNLKIPYLEIGFWARSSEAGKGYISTAVKLLEEYAVSELNVKRLEIKTAESNIASQRVAEKTGFLYEATIHSNRILPTGEIDNTCIYYKLYP